MADATDAVGTLVDDRIDAIRIGVLGPLTVHDGAGPIHIAGVHRRRLLALLASRPGQAISVDTIIDALWGDDPPPTAAKTLQSHVVRLRRSLTDAHANLIETVPGGYRLAVAREAIDAERFELQAIDARARAASGDPVGAAKAFADALDLWRGPAYLEFTDWYFAGAATVRLDELRLTVREELAAAQIASGSAIAAVVGLERLVHDAPGREHAWRLLMDALALTGRQHDALGAYQRARRALADFGLQPGTELQEAERRLIGSETHQPPATGPSMLAAALRTSSAMVGRETERRVLQAAWTAAKTGAGQLRVLSGPLESGRTRLAADLAGRVLSDGGAVEYARGDDLTTLVAGGRGTDIAAGLLVDDVAERCRRTPLLLVVDDAEWSGKRPIEAIQALAAATDQLSLLLLLIVDPSGGGPAVNAILRLDPDRARVIELAALPPDQIAAIVAADGVEDGAIPGIVAASNGLPGVARREAAVWAERTASMRLQAAAASSIGALSEAHRAQASVLDEVVELVSARARRDELWSARWAGRQPYRALTAYGPQDAELFVGRERLVAELAARVLESRLVVVVGASGSGKSSLVRAGLVPLARSSRLPGGEPWQTHVIVPGFEPLAALDSLEEIDRPIPQLLVVDQFEEVFASPRAVLERFIQQLVQLSGDPGMDVHVVVVVRSDELGRLTSTGLMSESIAHAQVIVGAPSEDEFRRIVIEPARRTGVAVDPSLVELVLGDVGGHDAALPLVSATLAEVWERRDGGTLAAATYVELGGLSSAVQRLGEQAIDRIGAANVDELRFVLLALADVTEEGTWTRRRVRAADLADRWRAVDALVESRLVVSDEQVVEIAHEAVFRAWPQLVEWLNEGRADMVLERDLRIAARTWDADGRLDDSVYRGARLHAALEWAERRPTAGTGVLEEFLDAGRALKQREQQSVLDQLARERRWRRRLSWALTVAAALLTFAVIAGAVALVSRHNAQDAAALAAEQRLAAEAAQAEADDAAADASQRQAEAEAARGEADEAAALAEQRQAEAEDAQRATEAERNKARVARLVAESERQTHTQLDLALLLAVEARNQENSVATRGALLTALTAHVSAQSANPPSDAVGADIPRTSSSFLGFLAGPPRVFWKIALSADGSVVVAAGDDPDGERGLAVVFDTRTRAEIGRIQTDDRIYEAVVSADGRYVVATDFTEFHRLDLATGEEITGDAEGIAGDSQDGFLVLHPDGQRFIVLGVDSYAIWDIASLTPLSNPRPLPTSDSWPADFAPDGSMLIVDRVASEAVWLDVDSGAEVRRLHLEPKTTPIVLIDFALSRDGSALAGMESNGQVVLWDLATGALRGSQNDRPGNAFSIEFDPASTTQLAIGRISGGVSLVDTTHDRTLGDSLLVSQGPTPAIGFSADGSILAAASNNGSVSLWGANDQDALIVDRIGENMTKPFTSPSGVTVYVQADQRLAITSDNGTTPKIIAHHQDGQPVRLAFDTRPRVSADGSTVAAVDEDHALFVADASSGEVVWAIETPDPRFQLPVDWAISPNGSLMAVSDSTKIDLWDVRRDEQLTSIPFAELSTNARSAPPSFSLDGESLYVPMDREVVRLSLSTLASAGQLTAPSRVLTEVVEIPGTDSAVAAGVNGALLRWDTTTDEVEMVGTTSGNAVPSFPTVSPDGSKLAVYRQARSEIELFDTGSLRALGLPIPAGDYVFLPSFTSDSTGLLGNGVRNDATRWELDPDVWESTACRAAGRNLTAAEWAEYIGPDEPYRATCDQWPALAG